MSARVTFTAMIAALLVAGSVQHQVSAEDSPGTTGTAELGESPSSPSTMEGAKGLFFEQLKKPTESINTGLRYWIELTRNGTTAHVTNKVQFKAGDKIRFHLKANIDGYAYILLANGSRGEQSILFPVNNENNHLERGIEYTLPSTKGGDLLFDGNPGTEQVTLLLSRNPIDARAYLSKPATQRTLIASSHVGSKDLVPSQICIAYAPTNEPKGSIVTDTEPANSKGTAAPKVLHKVRVEQSQTLEKKPAVKLDPADEGVTTVIKKDPSGVLHVDVDLDHRS